MSTVRGDAEVNARDTLELLDRLEQLGFDDNAFALLHFHREDGKSETITRHRRYCAGCNELKADGNNARVQQRLRLVLRACELAGFSSHRPDVFELLAQAAYAEIPPTGRYASK
jgi:hypothetical protein